MQTGDNIRDQIKNAVINGRGDDGGWRKNIRLHLNGYMILTSRRPFEVKINIESLIKNQITVSSRVIEFNVD